ncbi:uncharacterized protein EI90DRAFT_3034253 [Cantharellus anzutake]|uniref:uncharacterized protein n=1 Tax=Cantharellus anzutake TaxID=1750568 RepID=UPI001906135F|nr:uncharacterized protein EI90DRAFT_3034253 [Cantharellus anzutake]KAF8341532.1 hypothetical protein EI90DRAFT_3034253 [Cantharellus anzutake]
MESGRLIGDDRIGRMLAATRSAGNPPATAWSTNTLRNAIFSSFDRTLCVIGSELLTTTTRRKLALSRGEREQGPEIEAETSNRTSGLQWFLFVVGKHTPPMTRQCLRRKQFKLLRANKNHAFWRWNRSAEQYGLPTGGNGSPERILSETNAIHPQ